MNVWVVLVGTAIFITTRFKENRRQWLIGCVGALLIGAIHTVVLFRLAEASHSTGGAFLAALAPLIGFQTALIFFPLIWGGAGLLTGISRRPAPRVSLINGAAFLFSAAWVVFPPGAGRAVGGGFGR